MKMKNLGMLAAGALALAASPAVMAQATCDDVVWGDGVLSVYPDIDDACDEVVIGTDGTMYAKIDARFHRMTNAGDVIVYVEENDGDADPVRFTPPEDSTVNVEGVETPWSDLYDRQALRFYVPSDRFALLSDVDTEPMVAVVHVEEVDTVTVDTNMDMDDNMDDDIVMPTTASNNGLWLLTGLMLLLGSGGLLARQRS